MPPIGTEQGELGAGNILDVGRKGFEFAFEPDRAPEDFTTGQSSRKMAQPQRQDLSRRWRARWLQ
jgi:hypothetical protein